MPVKQPAIATEIDSDPSATRAPAPMQVRSSLTSVAAANDSMASTGSNKCESNMAAPHTLGCRRPQGFLETHFAERASHECKGADDACVDIGEKDCQECGAYRRWGPTGDGSSRDHGR